MFLFISTQLFLVSLLFKKSNLEKLLTFSVIFLIFPSILTVEYGNRWNYTILFLVSMNLELLITKILIKKNQRKKI